MTKSWKPLQILHRIRGRQVDPPKKLTIEETVTAWIDQSKSDYPNSFEFVSQENSALGGIAADFSPFRRKNKKRLHKQHIQSWVVRHNANVWQAHYPY